MSVPSDEANKEPNLSTITNENGQGLEQNLDIFPNEDGYDFPFKNSHL